MSQNKDDYREHYARLAKEFHTLPRVVVRVPSATGPETAALGELQVLDLRQDSGYGAGVMLDPTNNAKFHKYQFERAEHVHLFSTYRDQLMQLFNRGATWDGNLISKEQRTTLCRLGLAIQCGDGWTIITTAGVKEALKAGWAHA